MSWLEIATEEIKRHEGCKLSAYPDSGTGAAPWTIGYGATGPEIVEGTTWTQEKADNDLAARLNTLGEHIDAVVHVDINDNQKAALCSFAYNVGMGNLKSSTLLRLLNEGDYAGAAEQFNQWTKAADHVLAGLVTRREEESKLFLT
jgi:lysozyme